MPIFIKIIKSIINNLPKQKLPSSEQCVGEFYQYLRKELYQFSKSHSEDRKRDTFLLILALPKTTHRPSKKTTHEYIP